MNTELLNEVKAYRNCIAGACEVQDQRLKQQYWERAHEMARALTRKYGPEAFARIDDMAWYWS